MTAGLIFLGGIVYLVVSLVCFGFFGLDHINPIKNYSEWSSFNWFGVGTVTILIWLITLPWSLLVGLYYFIRFLFTVGRK